MRQHVGNGYDTEWIIRDNGYYTEWMKETIWVLCRMNERDNGYYAECNESDNGYYDRMNERDNVYYREWTNETMSIIQNEWMRQCV